MVMPAPSRDRPLHILLVEDNPGDARLAVEAFRQSDILNTIHVVENGVEAMAFLHREGRYAEAPRPDLMLLDLNMPLMDGREVLAEVKGDPGLRSIPVIVLTVSTAADDISTSYEMQANCYLAKPLDLDEFEKLIGMVNHFWLGTVKLPPG